MAMANHIYTIYRDFELILKSIKYSNMSLLWPNPWSLWLTQLNIINVEIQFELIFDAHDSVRDRTNWTIYQICISNLNKQKKTSASTWTLNSIQSSQRILYIKWLLKYSIGNYVHSIPIDMCPKSFGWSIFWNRKAGKNSVVRLIIIHN